MGILFFHEFSDRLCKFIGDVSRNGVRRVLALTDRRNALEKDNPWKLLKAGVSDVFALEYPAKIAEKIITRLKRWIAVENLIDRLVVCDSLIGQSPAWRSVLRQVVEVAHFTDSSMLITGEMRRPAAFSCRSQRRMSGLACIMGQTLAVRSPLTWGVPRSIGRNRKSQWVSASRPASPWNRCSGAQKGTLVF